MVFIREKATASPLLLLCHTAQSNAGISSVCSSSSKRTACVCNMPCVRVCVCVYVRRLSFFLSFFIAARLSMHTYYTRARIIRARARFTVVVLGPRAPRRVCVYVMKYARPRAACLRRANILEPIIGMLFMEAT